MQSIFVLLQEVGNVVLHHPSVVVHVEGFLCILLLGARLTEIGMAGMSLDNLLQEALVRAFRNTDLLIDHGEDTSSFLLQQVQRGLIVFELNRCNVNTLAFVLILFQAENMFVEVELELFVTKVDTQLLEGVKFERFESKDVKYTDSVKGSFLRYHAKC